MTERGHDSNQPLLQKNDGKRNLSTRLKISLFAFLGGIGIEMRSISQTQYVYSYLKHHADINNTVSNGNTNITSEQDENCQGNSTSTNDDYIQGLASNWTWYIQLVIYSIGLPIVIIAGPLSDRIGRKSLVVYNLVLSSISFSARTYVVYAKLNLNWFLLSCGVEGLAGSHYVFHFALSAMLADCTTPDKHRSFALTVYDTMLGIGVCCSQVATGYLIKDTNYTYPFLISTVLTLFMLILFLLAITEGNRFSKNKNSTASSSKFRLICALWTNTNSLVRTRRRSLLIIFLTFGLHHFPLAANKTIRTLYTLGWPFCWSPIQIGWYGAGSHFVEYVFGILILKYSLLCMRDETITILGFVSTIACFVLFGFSTNDWMIYTATVLGIIRVLPIPLLKAIMSRMVHSDKQGALFANIYLLEAVCRLGGSTLFNNIYHKTRPLFKGMVFFVMAGFPLFASLLLICMSFSKPQKVHTEVIVEEPTIQTKDNQGSNIDKQSET